MRSTKTLTWVDGLGSTRASSSDPLQRLDPWPHVLEELSQRGVLLELLPGEGPEALENRIGTELMALYRDTRSEAGFEALYAFARAAVLRWIQSLIARGPRHLDPVDLLQDTFVNVFRYPGGFRQEHAGSFRVWVRTIAANIVRRSTARQPALSFHELPEGCQEPADSGDGPEHLAIEVEQVHRLREAWLLFLVHYARAWGELSPRDRLALRLVELEGQSYEEAGRILKVRHSNMKMIVFRSRKRIASHMRGAMRQGRLFAAEQKTESADGVRLAG
jgi:RNA polymerase sigma factor (sigma-70 family)